MRDFSGFQVGARPGTSSAGAAGDVPGIDPAVAAGLVAAMRVHAARVRRPSPPPAPAGRAGPGVGRPRSMAEKREILQRSQALRDAYYRRAGRAPSALEDGMVGMVARQVAERAGRWW